MFKNIMLAAVCAFTVLSASAVQVKQYSKAAAIETFLRAVAYQDSDAMWQLIPPGMREQLSVAGEEEAKKAFWDGFKGSFPASQIGVFKQILDDQSVKDMVIAEMLKEVGPMMVMENGKWYIDFIKYASLKTNPEQKAAAAPKKIDHSSKESLMSSFYLAVLNGDADTAWEAFAPGFRAVAAPNEAAVAQAKKEFMSEFQNAMSPEMRHQLKMILSGDKKHEAAGQLVKQFEKCLVFQNGKWYIDFRMMMQ